MRISKMVLNFALLTAVASISATSAASSTCNMRNGAGRDAQTNPKQARQAKPVQKSEGIAQKAMSHKWKGKR